MNPFDIIQRTPKTNCGECGHLTCMAFAVAVTKTGENPTHCPYINLQGLTIEQSSAKNLQDIGQERDLALIEHLKSKIATLEFSVIASSLGVTLDDNQHDTLNFSYLGQKVVLNKNTILINGSEPEDPRDQILLYNYISSGGGRPPENVWIGMESMPNSISKVKTLATYCENRLADLFSKTDHDQILFLAKQLDGVQDQDSTASIGIIFPVLPMIPEFMLFWDQEPEEGFEAKIKLLFDHHTLDFLDIESLVFSAER